MWCFPLSGRGGEARGRLEVWRALPGLPEPNQQALYDRVCALATLAFEHDALVRLLKRQAREDALTGLPNRAAFEEQLNAALETQADRGGPLALRVLGLDGFKHINDSLGHAFGDDFLRAVAERLRLALPAGDLLARMGGDEFALLSPQQARERLELDMALRQALGAGEFTLYYQPQVDESGRIQALEALLRWNRPGHGLLGPERFIALCEDTGFIVPLGQWVLEQACQQAARWHSLGLPAVRIGVNVSPVQLGASGFAAGVKAALEVSGLKPDLLDLELTEGALMYSLNAGIDVLGVLHALGMQLSIDDFGMGYSSLGRLQRLPVDRLKIDRSFVSGLEQDPTKRSLLETVVLLASRLKLETVAEGVETPEQAQFLWDLGCTLQQGFLHARPAPATEVERWLTGGLSRRSAYAPQSILPSSG